MDTETWTFSAGHQTDKLILGSCKWRLNGRPRYTISVSNWHGWRSSERAKWSDTGTGSQRRRASKGVIVSPQVVSTWEEGNKKKSWADRSDVLGWWLMGQAAWRVLSTWCILTRCPTRPSQFTTISHHSPCIPPEDTSKSDSIVSLFIPIIFSSADPDFIRSHKRIQQNLTT